MLSEEALAAEGDRGAEEVGQHGEAETARTARGCPRWWCWSHRRSGGTEGSLPCSGVKEGWLPSEREWRSRRRSPCWGGAGNGDSLLAALKPEEPSLSARRRRVEPSTMLGRSRERGLAAGCPQTGGAIAVRQEAERRAVHQRMSSTIAWHRE